MCIRENVAVPVLCFLVTLISCTVAPAETVAFARYETGGWIFEPSGLSSEGSIEAILAWRAADTAGASGQLTSGTSPEGPSVMIFFPSDSIPAWLRDSIDRFPVLSEPAHGWTRIAWTSPRSAMGPLMAFMQRWGRAIEHSAIPERFRPTGVEDQKAFLPDAGFRVLAESGASATGGREPPTNPDTIDDVAEFFRVALAADELAKAVGAGLQLDGGEAVVIQPWVGWVTSSQAMVEEADLEEPTIDKGTGAMGSVGRFYFDSRDSRNDDITIGDCVCVYLRIRSAYHIEGDSISSRTRTERRIRQCDESGSCSPGHSLD